VYGTNRVSSFRFPPFVFYRVFPPLSSLIKGYLGCCSVGLFVLVTMGDGVIRIWNTTRGMYLYNKSKEGFEYCGNVGFSIVGVCSNLAVAPTLVVNVVVLPGARKGITFRNRGST